MYNRKEMEKLFSKQTPFLSYPGVRRPIIIQFVCANCGEIHYQLKCCRSIWCPICNLKLAGKTYAIMKKVNEKIPKSYIRVFITLTFVNQEKLTKRIFDQLRNCFTKKFLRRKKIKKQLHGGIYSFDWTINSRRTTHPFNIHIHLFGFQKGYINQKRLSEIWHSCTGDAEIVDIRKVKNISKAIFEVQKYIRANKSIIHAEENRREELVQAVQKIRRHSRFGIAYKIKLPKEKAKCKKCSSVLYYCQEPVYQEMFGIYD